MAAIMSTADTNIMLFMKYNHILE